MEPRALRVLAAALIVAALVPASTAGAQADGRTPTLALAAQTAWVGPDLRFDAHIVVGNLPAGAARDGLELALTVFGRIPFRSQFVQTVEGRLLGSVVSHQSTPLSELPPAPGGSVGISATPPLRREGVYPARVELRERDDGDVLASMTTHLVYVPNPPPGDALHLAWIAPVDTSPVVAPDASVDMSRGELASLAALAQALSSHPDVAATIGVVPETLDGLASRATPAGERPVLGAIMRAATSRPVIGGTYMPVDVDALLEAGLEADLNAQLDRGRATAARILGAEPDNSVWIARRPMSPGAIEWLSGRGVERFVVDESAMEPARLSTTLTAPFELAIAGDTRPLAAGIDAGLTAHFDNDLPPVLAAHRLLADLAVIYFDRPGASDRGVVALPPAGWHADPAFLDAFLSGVSASPIVDTSTIGELLDGIAPAQQNSKPLVRRLRTDDGVTLPSASIADARRRLESFGSLLDPGNARYAELERLLFIAESSGVSGRRRLTYVRGLEAAIDHELSLVQIPRSASIRLTAREGEIPISILSRTGYPVRVVVRVESNTLDFPGGGERIVTLARQTTIERVPVEARGPGAFPLEVRLLSPDGQLSVATSRFTIRSTAASWVGLALSIGAGLFLALWWGRHIHGRRSGKLVPS